MSIWDRGLLCLLAIYPRRKLSYGFVGGSFIFFFFFCFSMMGNLEEEGDFGGESVVPEGKAVLWPWCAPLSCQVCFVGLILCNFCPPY